jgi:serine/threonine protein phosphatase 1
MHDDQVTHFPAIRLAEGPHADTPAELCCRKLKELSDRLDQCHALGKGQFVKWKSGLKNRKFPDYGEPAIVTVVLPCPSSTPARFRPQAPIFRSPCRSSSARIERTTSSNSAATVEDSSPSNPETRAARPVPQDDLRTDAIAAPLGAVPACVRKFERLLDLCSDHANGRSARLITLGDYVDRGPDSYGVVQLIRYHLAREYPVFKSVINLKGNHDDMMVQAVLGGELSAKQNWVSSDSGGDATVESYPNKKILSDDAKWLAALPTSYEDKLRYYVHAGIRPGVPLNVQNDADKLWIRDLFLQHKASHEKMSSTGRGREVRSDSETCSRKAGVGIVDDRVVSLARYPHLIDCGAGRLLQAHLRAPRRHEYSRETWQPGKRLGNACSVA